jgi:hypothetical protein
MHSPVTGFNMHILGLYQAVESVSRRQIKPSCASISYKYLKTNAGDFGEYEPMRCGFVKIRSSGMFSRYIYLSII